VGVGITLAFGTVYRCILALNRNDTIRSLFPMTDTCLVLGDAGCAAAFDFNRELHYIERIASASSAIAPVKGRREPRITLKLHFAVTPRAVSAWYAPALSRATSWYDRIARAAFVVGIDPTTSQAAGAWFCATFSNVCTHVFATFIRHIGADAFTWLLVSALLSVLWAVVGSFSSAFTLLTSYVHYVYYVAVFYSRPAPASAEVAVGDSNASAMAYHAFVRDVVFWKATAHVHLARLVLPAVFALFTGAWTQNTSTALAWLGLALFAVGYGLNFVAAYALGLTRTYFGAELQRCAPTHISSFPYSCGIRHPMITGNIIGLFGMALVLVAGANAQVIASTYPMWLIPGHIICYILHALQEEFNVTDSPIQSAKYD
jgi:hypothetical protein